MRRGCVTVQCPYLVSLRSALVTECRFSFLFSVARRHQRSTAARPRISAWRHATTAHERKVREQAEATEAARRQAGRVSSICRPELCEKDAQGEYFGRRSWRFSSFCNWRRREMPMNPLHQLQQAEPNDGSDRATHRLLKAIENLRGKSERRKAEVIVQITDEQKKHIVRRHVQRKWYRCLYHPFEGVSDGQIKWGRRIGHGLIILCGLIGASILLYVYYMEMRTVLRLSSEDRQDYIHMVTGMRYSEIFHLGREVLKKEDPLEALPQSVRYHLVIDACRQKGWHEMDWEVERRSRYPRSAIEEGDYIHLLYWAMMSIGTIITGGGSAFSNRLGNLTELQQQDATQNLEQSLTPVGPTSLPTKRRKSFFD